MEIVLDNTEVVGVTPVAKRFENILDLRLKVFRVTEAEGSSEHRDQNGSLDTVWMVGEEVQV